MKNLRRRNRLSKVLLKQEMIEEIPKQLQQPEFRFNLLQREKKEPIEQNWQNTCNYKFDHPKIELHLSEGGNIGVVLGYGSLVVVDADTEEINEIAKTLPETFTIKTGNPDKHKHHYYFIVEK